MLEHIHSKGVCHRDLKPENILLDAKYHIKIVREDFLIGYRVILGILKTFWKKLRSRLLENQRLVQEEEPMKYQMKAS